MNETGGEKTLQIATYIGYSRGNNNNNLLTFLEFCFNKLCFEIRTARQGFIPKKVPYRCYTFVWSCELSAGCVFCLRVNASSVRGVDASCLERTVRVQQARQTAVRASHLQNKKMGLEKEKSETSVIMDEDEFNRSIEPILGKKTKVYSDVPNRDPNDINSHLKVGDNLMREILI